MGDDEEPEDDRRPHHGESDGTHGVAPHLVPGTFPVVACLPQQEGNAHDGAEEDELLAEGVEAAIVEHDRRDNVGDVAFPTGDAVHDLAVLAVEPPERRQSGEPPDEYGPEDSGGRSEQDEAPAAAHFRRRPCILASAVKRMNGVATLETTISDSATSGAWSTTKSTASASP